MTNVFYFYIIVTIDAYIITSSHGRHSTHLWSERGYKNGYGNDEKGPRNDENKPLTSDDDNDVFDGSSLHSTHESVSKPSTSGTDLGDEESSTKENVEHINDEFEDKSIEDEVSDGSFSDENKVSRPVIHQWEIDDQPVAESDLIMDKDIKHVEDIRKFTSIFIKKLFDQGTIFNVSDCMRRLLMGLIIHKDRFNDYDIDYSFIFEEDDEYECLQGYPLGRDLNYLLDLIDLFEKSKSLYHKYHQKLTQRNINFTHDDIKYSNKLLKSIQFPINQYIEKRKRIDRETIPMNTIVSKLRQWDLFHGIKRLSSTGLNKGDVEGDEENEYTIDAKRRANEASDIILNYLFDERDRLLDSLIFRNPQKLPEPTNKVSIRTDVLKKIVNEILNHNKFSNTCPLIKRNTRAELEGGHHYAFYHWSFEQVIQAMILFNDIYYDYNYDLFRKGEEFEPITFNILKSSWRVPENEFWPNEFWGMPLGLFIKQFREGDIDAKEHWLRRPIMDHIGFNWGDGLKYLKFTWAKFFNGIIWFINYRGHPIICLPPELTIPKTITVAKFGKPEEIQVSYLKRTRYHQPKVIPPLFPLASTRSPIQLCSTRLHRRSCRQLFQFTPRKR